LRGYGSGRGNDSSPETESVNDLAGTAERTTVVNTAELDAARRIADVKRKIAEQIEVRFELKAKGLPVGPTDRIIEILRCCQEIIEASQRPYAEPPISLPAPSGASAKAA
jgi:hypothetical protein